MKKIGLYAAMFLVLLSAPLVRAEAQQLTDQQITAIRLGCANAVQGLRQVQQAEAASRVNRGRGYEQLLRLLTALNSRTELSKLNEPEMRSITNKLQTKVASFQKNYGIYADRLDDTMSVRCTDAPVTFYDSLTATRDARKKVATDIDDIDKLIKDYQVELTKLKTTIVELEKGVNR